MYHYTRDLQHGRYPNIKGLDYSLFKEQIEFFSENFNVVTMQQVIEACNGNHDSLPEKALLLTFDDGYVDNFTYALPILMQYGMQGSFFIPGKTFDTHALLDVNKIHYVLASADISVLLPSLLERMNFYRGSEFDYPDNDALFSRYAQASRFDNKETVFVKRMLQTVLPEALRNRISSDLFAEYVGISEQQLACELYMNADQIAFMKKEGMFIGLHGYDHYWLANLPEEQMHADISKALEVMREFIDANSWVMNYPYGNYNEKVIDYIKSRGAVLGLTSRVDVARPGVDSPFELPRLDCNDYPPKSSNYMDYV